MLDQIAVQAPVNGTGTPPSPLPGPTPQEPCAAEWEAPLRQWLDSFFVATSSPSCADVKTLLATNHKRQHRFLGFRDGERFELQVVEPDIKDPKRKYNEQSNKFAYTETIPGGCRLLYEAGQEFGFQGLYIIPQVVNPAALSKAAPDTWHMPAKGAGTDRKDILSFLVSYADFDTVREGGAKKVSATHDELMVSCERGIQFYCDAADIMGSAGFLAFVFSGNGCQVHVALDRLLHDPTDNSNHCPVQRLRVEFVHIVNILYSGGGVVGDDTVCNPNRLCPATGTLKCKGYNDTKLGRVHRLTGIYCAETVERLSLEQFRRLVETLRTRLTDEQREALSKKTKGGKNATTAPGSTMITSKSATTRTKAAEPNPYELANAIPIREVYAKLGADPSTPKCPGCGADDTTNFLDDKLGVQSLKCLHATCGARSWKNIDLVVVLGLGKSIDDQDARREAVHWITEHFPEHQIPKLTKGRAAAKAEVDALIAATPSYFDDMIETCSATSTDEELRQVVEAVQTRDVAPAAMLIKALTKKTGISKTDLLKLTKHTTGSVPSPADYSDAEWPTKLQRSPKGFVRSTFANAVTVLAHDPRWAGRLAWCEFTHRIVTSSAPPWSSESASTTAFDPGTAWVEGDDHRLVDYLERFYGIQVTPKQAYNAAYLAADKRHVHPVRDYLRGLTWDGKRRLDTVLPVYFGTRENSYTRMVGPWTFMQAVKRIFEPGCQADYVPVFEGEQGIQKSSAIRALCPDPAWVSDTMFTIGSKDAMVALRGRWFIELAEAMTLLRAEHAASKAFFTSRCDDYRPPYGMHNVQVPRQCMFFATINPEGGYLRDPTGNRRYWPIACGEVGPIDIAGLRRDRDQLWAEAVARHNNGERCYPNKQDEHDLFGSQQDERGEQDPWHEEVEKELRDLTEVTVAFVLTHLLCIETARQEPRFQTRIIKILTSLGWRLRGVGKAPEDDPEKLAKGKKRKSVRIYARIEAIDEAIPFAPGMTRQDLLFQRDRRAGNDNSTAMPSDLLDNV
jgi:predicted P-loop ATPase